MLRIPGSPVRLCEGVSRRDLLRIGTLGTCGLTLPDLLRRNQAAAAGGHAAQADACVLIYLFGGPSQFETFDPKPDASREIRGEFGAIPTSVPGVFVGEHIPLLAQQAHKFRLFHTSPQSVVAPHHGGTYRAHPGL